MTTLQVNGNVYTEANLVGKQYTETFPNLCRDLYLSLYKTQTAVCRQVFTIALGTFSFRVELNKGYYTGMPFAAFPEPPLSKDYSSYTDNAPLFSGKILNYDRGTGILRVRVDHLFTHGTYKLIYFSTNVVVAKAVSNTIANQLTAATGQRETNLALKRGSLGMSNIRNGLGPMADGLPPPYYASVSGTGTVESYYSDPYGSLVAYPSALTLKPGTGRAAVYLGRKPWIMFNQSIWGVFRFRSNTALSDGTNTYKITLGFRGYGSTEAAPLGHSGVGITYTHSENGGNWVLRSGNNGSLAPVNSSAAFTASTEFEVKIRQEGSNTKAYVNTVLLGTIASPSTLNINNLVHPFIMIERSAGTVSYIPAQEMKVGGF